MILLLYVVHVRVHPILSVLSPTFSATCRSYIDPSPALNKERARAVKEVI